MMLYKRLCRRSHASLQSSLKLPPQGKLQGFLQASRVSDLLSLTTLARARCRVRRDVLVESICAQNATGRTPSPGRTPSRHAQTMP
eukprot:5454874-Amphidinium_carterae.1